MSLLLHILVITLFAASCGERSRALLPGGASGMESGESDGAHSRMVRRLGAASGNVKCELQDRAGNIWFSTGGEGVYRFDGTTFTNFTTTNGLADNDIVSIIETMAGEILVATGDGVSEFDGRAFTRYRGLESIDTLGITCLFQDRDSNLWIGTKRHGVFRSDGDTVVNFLSGLEHKLNLGREHELILDILQDRSGHLWFSSWNRGGVWRYDGTVFTHFVPSADYYAPPPVPDSRQSLRPPDYYSPAPTSATTLRPSETITDDMIFSMAEDRSGALWFATRDHGVCRYDGKSFTTIWRTEGFNSRGAYSILQARHGDIWITTDKDGVWRYDGTTFTNYTTRDGLVNNSVFSVLEDRKGNLWFGTRGFGLSRYDGTEFVTMSE